MLSLLVTKHAQYDDGEELPLESSLRMFAGTYVLSRGRSTFGGPEAYTDWDPFCGNLVHSFIWNHQSSSG